MNRLESLAVGRLTRRLVAGTVGQSAGWRWAGVAGGRLGEQASTQVSKQTGSLDGKLASLVDLHSRARAWKLTRPARRCYAGGDIGRL